jgi:hypothetical protein
MVGFWTTARGRSKGLAAEQAGRVAPRGGCWPTADQILLLRAALLEADEAREAWVSWRTANNPDTADGGSLRLLPLVYRNLGPASLDESDRHKLKGAYRAAWLRNQLLFKRAAEALHLLHEAGIRTMLLKGVALTVAHYRDPGVRPMDDIDVLVAPQDATRALSVLTRAGWEADPAAGADLVTGKAQQLHDRSGRSLDLHRYALWQATDDDDFWTASVEIELLGVRTRSLSPADQLLHVAAHGASWNTIPPVRWLADAVAIERSAGAELDWNRLTSQAERRRLTLSAAAALEQLVATLGFDVPPGVLDRLRSAPTTRLERWAHRGATRPIGGGNRLPVVLEQYVRMSRLDPSLRLTAYLQATLGARTRGQLAGRFAEKGVELALAQTARLVAPQLIRPCTTCGRQLVRLRATAPRLCGPCARAPGPS